MPKVEVLRTYLVHDRGAPNAGAPPLEGLVLEPVPECPVALYRWLYAETGRAWHWIDRLGWTDEQIAAHLADPRNTILMLRRGPLPAGWVELQERDDGSVEIVYFGLLPWMTGQGLGRWFLEAALDAAYAKSEGRVTLNTCTLDHPAALPNYLARGFRILGDETYVADLPDA